MAKQKKKESDKKADLLVCRNPKARKLYEIEEKLEAGLVLVGSEVKSLRNRRGDLEGSYAGFHGDELFLYKMHIAPYEQATAFGHEPTRVRKLLLHRRELEKLHTRLTIRGYTLVPLSVYFKNGHAKVELGLGKGRAKRDKREEIKRDLDKKEARQVMQKHRR
ncbi:MAG: SsrA-binding protein SmpB [Myxococcales bacterium]|nr:MAG: SsrA-binding protein SmpB [Myxococcales bacterium]